MKKPRLFTKLKKITPVIIFSLSVLFFMVLFLSKNKLNEFASRSIKLEVGTIVETELKLKLDSLYNYSKNGLPYEITFLEFGSTGCSACKRMEKVMDEIKQQYPNQVNVVFYNVTLHKNHDLMKYFGIVVIPTQVLLDQHGKEFFRHTGFYPTRKLINHINQEIH